MESVLEQLVGQSLDLQAQDSQPIYRVWDAKLNRYPQPSSHFGLMPTIFLKRINFQSADLLHVQCEIAT